jgi:uncharacterized Zn ribbon protein
MARKQSGDAVVLSDGDSVIVSKDLKVKGSSVTLQSGTKIQGIRCTAPTGARSSLALDSDGARG